MWLKHGVRMMASYPADISRNDTIPARLQTRRILPTTLLPRRDAPSHSYTYLLIDPAKHNTAEKSPLFFLA